MKSTLLIVFVLLCAKCYGFPDNPCPQVFQYVQYKGQIYGQIEVLNDRSGTFELLVNVSIPTLTQSQNLGLQLLTPQEKLFRGINPIYRVVFPVQHPIARVTYISFNGKPMCYGPSDPVTSQGVTNLWAVSTLYLHNYQGSYHQQFAHRPVPPPFPFPGHGHFPPSYNDIGSNKPEHTYVYVTNIFPSTFAGQSSKPLSDTANRFDVPITKPFESNTPEQKPREPVTPKPFDITDIRPFNKPLSEDIPFESKPLDSRPFESKPFESKPFESKPFESKPFESKPFESKPFVTKPSESKPVLTNDRPNNIPTSNKPEPLPAPLNTPDEAIPPYPCDPDIDERIGGNVMCGFDNSLTDPPGETVKKGDFPWLVAIFQRYNLQRITYIYKCTGSLLSPKHILSAAHCFFAMLNNPLEEYVAVLGKQDIFNWAKNSVVRGIKDVIMHGQYQPITAENDLALLLLEAPVEFSNTIKPIKLWGNNDKGELVGKTGSVAGWGNQTSVAKKLDLSISSYGYCLKTSQPTFCAGAKDIGPCGSDSGAGLILTKNGQSFLKGLVTHVVGNDGKVICEAGNSVPFIDVTEFSSWINQQRQSS